MFNERAIEVKKNGVNQVLHRLQWTLNYYLAAIMQSQNARPAYCEIFFPEHGRIDLLISGDWKNAPRGALPTAQNWWRENVPLSSAGESSAQTVRIFTKKSLQDWDDRLPAFVYGIQRLARERNFPVERVEFPEALEQLLLTTSEAVPMPDGEHNLRRGHDVKFIDFIGECGIVLGKFFCGRAFIRRSDWVALLQQVGTNALPIVALISFLTGIILGFVGLIQLERFGAAIYVADLVGLAMAREMGAVMTGVITAGRSGAAFAATIGSRKVNEELDALKTFEFSPRELLVLPRILAMACMVPLLCILSAFIGIGGGMIVAVALFKVSAPQYIIETLSSVRLADFMIGVAKGSVFAVLVGGFGCLRGLQCRKDAAGVGEAATSAVVSGITAIILADALFAFLCNALHI
jgi:phospholipid/cholesterol/gamma-HCH transport system permease protein